MPEFGDAGLRAISADSRPAIKGSARPSSALKVFLGASGATQGYRDEWRWFGTLEYLWADLSPTIFHVESTSRGCVKLVTPRHAPPQGS